MNSEPDDQRRQRFLRWFETVLAGDRAALIARTGYTKGRVAQFFDAGQPFGEKAAQHLAHRLGLADNAFTGNPSSTGSAADGVGTQIPLVSSAVTPWEHLMRSPLEADFITEITDAAMHPEIPKGTRALFRPNVPPEPGDLVIVRTGGHLHLREYRQGRDGAFQAHAANPAFLSFDSAVDDLRVVAVFFGKIERRAR